MDTRGCEWSWGRLLMKESYGPTEQLQDLNWGAFNHASHAPHYKILQLLLGVLSAMNQYIALLSAISVKLNTIYKVFSDHLQNYFSYSTCQFSTSVPLYHDTSVSLISTGQSILLHWCLLLTIQPLHPFHNFHHKPGQVQLPAEEVHVHAHATYACVMLVIKQ